MSSTRKGKTSWAERVSASLTEGEYSARRVESVVTNSPYEDEIRKGLHQLREAELLTREIQTVVILAGGHAPKVASALERLRDNHMLTEKSMAAVGEVSQYADLFVEKLLTDENQAAAVVQAIKNSEHQAWEKLTGLVKALDFQKMATVIEFAKACIELKPFSYGFLKTLDDDVRYAFFCEILKKAAEGNQDEVRELFKKIVKLDPRLLSQMDSKGVFPLIFAIKSGNFGAVKLLIECDANPNQTMFGNTSMAFARHFHEKSNPEFVNQLNTIEKMQGDNRGLLQDSDQMELIFTAMLMGYPSNREGICFGCSTMGMQAFLIKGDYPGHHPGLDEFLRRSSKIQEITPEKHSEHLINARDKIKEAGSLEMANLTENEKFALELPAFFEGIELLQQATEYNFLYEDGRAPIKQSPEPSLRLTASRELEEQGGVVSVRRFSGVYDGQELTYYFEKFKNQATVPIALIIGSLKTTHAILVTYDPMSREFTIVDGLFHLKSSNTKEIVQKLISKFEVSNSQDVIRTTVFSAASDHAAASACCDNWLEEIKDIQKITAEKANFTTQQNKWISYAKRQGEVEVVKELLDTQNALDGYQGRALFMKQKNDVKVLEETKKINALRQHRLGH